MDNFCIQRPILAPFSQTSQATFSQDLQTIKPITFFEDYLPQAVAEFYVDKMHEGYVLTAEERQAQVTRLLNQINGTPDGKEFKNAGRLRIEFEDKEALAQALEKVFTNYAIDVCKNPGNCTTPEMSTEAFRVDEGWSDPTEIIKRHMDYAAFKLQLKKNLCNIANKKEGHLVGCPSYYL